LSFYKNNSWNFDLDSHSPCWQLYEIQIYFLHTPVGILKISIEISLIVFKILSILFIVYLST
jgi:hypothetical protein